MLACRDSGGEINHTSQSYASSVVPELIVLFAKWGWDRQMVDPEMVACSGARGQR